MVDFDTVVIGAGASGLAFALASIRKGARVMVLEQRSHLGGLGATREVKLPDGKSFPFDVHGGHVFNAQDPEVRDWAFRSLPKAEWLEHKRTSAALLPDGTWVDYPVERNGIDWKMFSPLGDYDVDSAGDYGKGLLSEYGEVAQRYLLHYDSKMWGSALPSLAPVFRPSTMPRSTPGARDGAHTHSTFYYPKVGGYGTVFKAIAGQVALWNQAAIRTMAEVTAIVPFSKWLDVCVKDYGTLSCRRVLYTGALTRLPRLLDYASIPEMDLQAAPLTCVLTNDSELCSLAKGKSWVYLPGKTYSGSLDCLNHFHKLDNVGLMAGRDGEVVSLVATKRGIGPVPGELDREEIDHAYPLPTKARAGVVVGAQAALAKLNIHLVGRLATWQHITVDRCIREALDLSRSFE
ncbi:MAG: NAD(P)-binding protein [Dehalococcoidia bacterium]|nr:NAD(P)-binding protein [Dehalococcoidia bacterium]